MREGKYGLWEKSGSLLLENVKLRVGHLEN